jgi:hypothetical protein
LGKMIDTAFVICFLIALLVLSMLGIVHALSKKPKGQDKPAALPDGWSRWILEAKKPKQMIGIGTNFQDLGDGMWHVLCGPVLGSWSSGKASVARCSVGLARAIASESSLAVFLVRPRSIL